MESEMIPQQDTEEQKLNVENAIKSIFQTGTFGQASLLEATDASGAKFLLGQELSP